MTDLTLHSELQYALVELQNTTQYASQLWTMEEVSATLTRVQRRILVDTGMVVSRATLVTVPNTPRHLLPDDYLGLRRVTWHSPDGRYGVLSPMTWLETDLNPQTQPHLSKPRPTGYLLPEDLTATLQLQVVPWASDGGVVEIWYLAQGDALANTGVETVLPDELADTLLAGTIRDLLLKEGRGYDPDRAAIMDLTYQEGLALAQAALLAGAR